MHRTAELRSFGVGVGRHRVGGLGGETDARQRKQHHRALGRPGGPCRATGIG
ncbi:hypothetical protein Y694_04524 [Methylibium sp. T29-B]|nr:hypothetical protein Y694_04524 [Methylibium sp. T29-B]